MRIVPFLLAGVALSATPALAAAPKAATKAVPTAAAAQAQAPSEVQQHAMLYLRVLISGLQADEVPQPVKSTLVGCLYNNTLATITQSLDTVIAQNPGKISRDNPTQVLSALAGICGYTPEAADAASSEQPTGR